MRHCSGGHTSSYCQFCAEVFILVNYLYLVIVDDSIRLGWRVFLKIYTHVFGFCCVQAQIQSITPCNSRLTSDWVKLYHLRLIKYLFGRMFLQSFVYKINKRGDKTHHWGEPVETTFTLEVVLFTRTCWGLPIKKIKHTANSDSSLNLEICFLNNKWGYNVLKAKLISR